jgi:hypothetical protein
MAAGLQSPSPPYQSGEQFVSVLEPFNPRHAAAAIIAMAQNNALPEALVSAILDVPVPRTDMRYDEGKSLELKRMSRLERTFDALLQDHNVMGVNDHGGIRIIPAPEQVATSQARGLKRLDSSLRTMMQEAKYVDTARFTNAQIVEQHNYGAWLDQLRRAMLPNSRPLKHAMPVDQRYSPAPGQVRPRPRIVHSVDEK